MTNALSQHFGKWYVECIPNDGGRISSLRYDDHDLLTPPPPIFRPPVKDYGEYETRPVYGYDDCFPSVSSCKHPVLDYYIRDHGDLCWRSWQAGIGDNKLICSAEYDKTEVRFIRTLEFKDNMLIWKFDITNLSKKHFDFLHVVHPLIPLNDIARIEMPDFKNIKGITNSGEIEFYDSGALNTYLLNIHSGDFDMLFLQNIQKGNIILNLKNGIRLQMEYPANIFPTLGIWWNNSGYPAEKGIERCECAFEPVPGIDSDLGSSFDKGVFLTVVPGKTFSWEFLWRIL